MCLAFADVVSGACFLFGTFCGYCVCFYIILFPFTCFLGAVWVLASWYCVLDFFVLALYSSSLLKCSPGCCLRVVWSLSLCPPFWCCGLLGGVAGFGVPFCWWSLAGGLCVVVVCVVWAESVCDFMALLRGRLEP